MRVRDADLPEGGDNLLLGAAAEVPILLVLQEPYHEAREEEEGASGEPHERREGAHEGPRMVALALLDGHHHRQPGRCVGLGKVHYYGPLRSDSNISHYRVVFLLMPSTHPLVNSLDPQHLSSFHLSTNDFHSERDIRLS